VAELSIVSVSPSPPGLAIPCGAGAARPGLRGSPGARPLPRDGVGQRLGVARPGGVLMLTVPSLAHVDSHDPGTDFWRFTPNGLAELLHRLGMPASVAGHGNVLACAASLWGPSVEELGAEELAVADPRFPLVAWAHAEKAR
jgi:hypothetical protein